MDDSLTAVNEPQSAAAVLMVRPASFGFNPQTAPSNAFQQAPDPAAAADGAAGAAQREFDGLADALERAGVEVIVAHDGVSPAKPDALFPNNWVSYHRDGTVVLYPMLAPNRRLERCEAVLEQVAREGRFRVNRTVDLTHREAHSQFLEGTGSMVLDRSNRVAYAALSPRTELDVLGEFAQLLDYELVTFDALDGAARPVYHTNVLMAVGAGFAVICAEAIADEVRRAAVLETLRDSGHEIIEISMGQMLEFAGNVLELRPAAGNLIAMSNTAWSSFDSAQRRRLESHGTVVAADISLIERLGGGGVRCMLAEIHLPKHL